LQVHQFLCKSPRASGVRIHPKLLDSNIDAVRPTGLRQPLDKGGEPRSKFRIDIRPSHQHADAPRLLMMSTTGLPSSQGTAVANIHAAQVQVGGRPDSSPAGNWRGRATCAKAARRITASRLQPDIANRAEVCIVVVSIHLSTGTVRTVSVVAEPPGHGKPVDCDGFTLCIGCGCAVALSYTHCEGSFVLDVSGLG
jgi:hypothetical protein